jgi:hypothetical protein
MPKTRRTHHDTASALSSLIEDHTAPNYFTFADVRERGGASETAQRRTGTLHIDNYVAVIVRGGWRVG